MDHGVLIDVVRHDTDVSVLAFSGEFDIASTASAWAALNPHLVEHHDVQVDLSGMEFMDSSGLSVFIQCRLHQESNGGSFSVTAMSPTTRHLLELAGLMKYLSAGTDGGGP